MGRMRSRVACACLRLSILIPIVYIGTDCACQSLSRLSFAADANETIDKLDRSMNYRIAWTLIHHDRWILFSSRDFLATL
jgi:hypothetical protein